MSDLNRSAKELITEKKSYEELITYTSEEDIQKANQTRKYEIELLWTKIGSYATKNGIILKLNVTNSSNNTPDMSDLNFDVTGSYISITDFISDLENDAQLSFSVDNFKLVPAATNNTQSSGTNLEATFVVKDIALNLENATIGSSSSSSTNDSTNSTTSVSNDEQNDNGNGSNDSNNK